MSVVEWLIDLVTGVFGFILSSIPEIPGFESVSNAMEPLMVWVRPVGNFVPWDSIGQASLFFLTGLGIALTIRVGRIVASFFTAGGGSAG